MKTEHYGKSYQWDIKTYLVIQYLETTNEHISNEIDERIIRRHFLCHFPRLQLLIEIERRNGKFPEIAERRRDNSVVALACNTVRCKCPQTV